MQSPLVSICLALAVTSSLLGHTSALYSSGSDVVSLTSSSFEKTLKEGLWMVEFYAPWCGHCKNLAPEWEKAAVALKGLVGVAAVDCDEHQSIAATHKIQGFPTIKLFYADKSGNLKSIDYQGGRQAKDIVTWAMQQAQKVALQRIGASSSGSSSSGSKSAGGGNDEFYKGTSVVSLNSDNFEKLVSESDDMYFVEFYAPWCGHCKALKGTWIDLANDFDSKTGLKVGAVNCDSPESKSVCSENGVRGFPTIKFFGHKNGRRFIENYQGDRDLGSMTAFAMERWAKEQPPPEVREITDPEVFIEHCTGHDADERVDLKAVKPKQLCLVAFLPHILDSKASGRASHLDMLKKVAETHKERPFAWFWAQGLAQAGLEKALGVGGYGYPAFVALNPSKEKYATLKSGFTEEAIKEFLGAVRQGRERVEPVNGDFSPDQLETKAPWDGQDAEEGLEEEFSLEELGLGGSNDEL